MALVQNGMAPRGIGAHEDHKVGLIEIVVAAGHHVGTEGASM